MKEEHIQSVYCPIIEGQIDGDDCMIIVDVSDHLIKPSILNDYPELNIHWSEEVCQKCLNCKWHADS